MLLWFSKGHCSTYVGIAVTLVAGLCSFWGGAIAKPRDGSVRDASRLSADICTQHPELFEVRPVTPEEGRRFATPGAGVPTIIGFDQGSVISGPCTRFIKTIGGVVTLTNNTRFVINDSALVPIPPGTSPPRSFFNPPKNIRAIASEKFAEGKGRSFVKSIDDGGEHTALWSGPKGSAIGTIHCTDGDDRGPCTLEHLILSSPYWIKNFGFVPPPHSEMGVGSLWFWTTVRQGEEALVGYTFAYENYLMGARNSNSRSVITVTMH